MGAWVNYGSRGGALVDARKWYAVAAITGGAIALAVYLAPYADARQSLAPLSVNAILKKSWSSLDRVPFGETLSYQNNLLPAGINLAGLVDLPLPSASVTTINLYQNSPRSWRLEEMSRGGAVVGVVARDNDRLVTYRSAVNQRTFEVLPESARSAWSLWQVPRPTLWRKDWVGRASRTRIAGVPAYQVTLRPKAGDTLFGSVTYWFQGRYFVPMGVEVKDRAGRTVFRAKTSVYTQGAPGSAANPPSAGRLVAWHVATGLAHLGTQFTGPKVPVHSLPPRLGPLKEINERRMGANAMAVYGDGPGRVIALVTPPRPFQGKDVHGLLQPVPGVKGFRGVTDGVFSVVTFAWGHEEVTLLGSRSQIQLARWAKAEWR